MKRNPKSKPLNPRPVSLFNKNLYVRTLSGIVLLGAVLGAVLWSPYSMLALALLLAAGSMTEFFRIARLSGARPMGGYALAVGCALVALVFAVAAGLATPKLLSMLLPPVFLPFVLELYRKGTSPAADIAWTLCGIVYAALPFALLAALAVRPAADGIAYSPLTVLGVIFIVWANDVGAYLSGSTWGRHKLFERISPKKSWEGFFGGVLCAVGVALLMALWQDAPFGLWAGAGAVIAVGGVLGDLVESMFKRSVGLKDSGTSIPGHGGFLDRFDALILAMPFVYAYFAIFTL